MQDFEKEAHIFTHYLVGRDATPQVVQLYAAALSTSKPDAATQKLLRLMTGHPRCIGIVDAGLVFHNASSEARRRLYVMLAILEANTEYCDLFLPTERSPFYVLVILYSCLRAVIRAALGVLLVKAVA